MKAILPLQICHTHTKKCKGIKVLPIKHEGRSVGMSLSTVMSPRIRALLKPRIFYTDSCERGLKPPLVTSFGDRTHLF